MKRIIRVTITKEIEVEFTAGVFGGMSEAEYLAEFRKALWHVDSIDDVFKYAAGCVASGPVPCKQDGLGLITHVNSPFPRRGDVLFRVIDEDSTLIDAGGAA